MPAVICNIITIVLLFQYYYYDWIVFFLISKLVLLEIKIKLNNNSFNKLLDNYDQFSFLNEYNDKHNTTILNCKYQTNYHILYAMVLISV